MTMTGHDDLTKAKAEALMALGDAALALMNINNYANEDEDGWAGDYSLLTDEYGEAISRETLEFNLMLAASNYTHVSGHCPIKLCL